MRQGVALPTEGVVDRENAVFIVVDATGLPSGNSGLPWIALFLLNAGIVMVAAQPFVDTAGALQAGRILETTGILLFAASVWRHVKPLQV